jgi:PAS domain-containing protein
MAASKPIQLILARQLASCVAIPILLLDEKGTLVYFNEPAEGILHQRFDETGEISAEELVRLVEVLDEDRRPIPREQRPTWIARLQHRPVSRTIWTRTENTDWLHLQATAVPLVAEANQFVGIMHLFWAL